MTPIRDKSRQNAAARDIPATAAAQTTKSAFHTASFSQQLVGQPAISTLSARAAVS
jgi:hypothetical protein